MYYDVHGCGVCVIEVWIGFAVWGMLVCCLDTSTVCSSHHVCVSLYACMFVVCVMCGVMCVCCYVEQAEVHVVPCVFDVNLYVCALMVLQQILLPAR